eukprot:SAG11_NODE_450_length_9391_cov_16.666272_3_plen_84_part_00
MGQALRCKLVGVVEKDSRHCPTDFAIEAQRAPADLKHVLADVEFLEYQRRNYLTDAMVSKLAELCTSAGEPEAEGRRTAGLGA